MFDELYYDFLNNINEFNYQRKDDKILINERKLKEQLCRLFSIITKSKDFITKTFGKVAQIQKKQKDGFDKATKMLNELNEKIKVKGRLSKSPLKTRRESMKYNKKNPTNNEKDMKTQSCTKEAHVAKKLPERSKTPDFNIKPRSSKERVSNNQKAQLKVTNGFPLTTAKKVDAIVYANDNKPIGRNTNTNIQMNSSPIRAKLSSTTKVTSKKILTKLSGSDTDPMATKNRQELSPTVVNREMKTVGFKESKSSLSNMGRRNSTQQTKSKSTLEKIRVSKRGSTEMSDPCFAFKNSISQMKGQMKMTHISSGQGGNRKIVIRYASVMDDFLKILYAKIRDRDRRSQDFDDSDITEINPLEL